MWWHKFLSFLSRKPILGLEEEVEILLGENAFSVLAKIDTGAVRSSLDKNFAKKLGINFNNGSNIVVKNSIGKEKRPLAKVKLRIKGKVFEVEANIADRKRLKHKLLLGQDILKHFIIDPNKK